MHHKILVFKISAMAAALFVLVWGLPAAAELYPALQEPPIIFQASDILPKNLRVGPGFRLDEPVRNDGIVNTYQLKSLYGAMTLESTALLKIRVNELWALDRMEDLKKTKIFTDALKAGAKGPLNTAKGLVTEPVDTVKDVGSGIGKWFSDIGRSVVSDDPYQENTLSTVIGYAAAKRKFAYEFGIDPYTNYEPLEKALAEIARVSVAGGLTPKMAFKAIEGAAGKVLSMTATSNTMRKLVRDKSPAELEKINKEKLKSMGVRDALAEALLASPVYNPYETTLLVGELHSMNHVMERENIIGAALMADEKTVAVFIRLSVQMMGSYNDNVIPILRMVNIDGIPFVQNKAGVIVGLFPMDHIGSTVAFWRRMNTISGSTKKMSGITGKEMWITGTFDPVMVKALESREWKAVDRAEDKLKADK